MKPALAVLRQALLAAAVLAACVLRPVQADATVTDCTSLLRALSAGAASTQVITITSTDLDLRGCASGPPGSKTLSGDIRIAPNGTAYLPVTMDQAFIDAYIVAGNLTFSSLFIIAPANRTLDTSNGFLPLVFVPTGQGKITFENSVVTLNSPVAWTYNQTSWSSYPNVSVPVSAPYPLQDLYSLGDVNWPPADVQRLLAGGGGDVFGTTLSTAVEPGGWRFVSSYAASPTSYAGGQIVADNIGFVTALNSTTVPTIYVATDIDVGAYFEASASRLLQYTYLIVVDTRIYGHYGAALNWRFVNHVVYVSPGVTLTIDGSLRFRRLGRPVFSTIPYNFLLAPFVLFEGATLIVRDAVIEHSADRDLELWQLTGTPVDPAYQLPPSIDNATWTADAYLLRRNYLSLSLLGRFSSLPATYKPRIVNDSGDLLIEAWNISVQVWDQVMYGRESMSSFLGSYQLTNVRLVKPVLDLNECNNTTGSPVFDSHTFKAAIMDSQVYRLKVTQSFRIDPGDWGTPGDPSTGLDILRNIRVVGCEGDDANQYTTIDTGNLGTVLYLQDSASIDFRRVALTNVHQAPQRGNNEAAVGMFSPQGQNSSLNFDSCSFEGSPSGLPGPMLTGQYSLPNEAGLLPNPNYTVTLVDPSNNQTSVLFAYWDLVMSIWVAATQGNASAPPGGPEAGSWNYVGCVVSSALPESGSSGLSASTLALAIALPVAALLLCLCLVILFCLYRRRRRQRLDKLLADEADDIDDDDADGFTDEHSVTTSMERSAIARSGHDADPDPHSIAMEDKIDAALLKMGKQAFSPNTWDQIKLGKCIGVGGFSRVYKGFWRGSVVAVKVIHLPEHLSRTEKLKRMTVMETAISSSLSHPNIIPTYTYAVRSTQQRPFANDVDVATEGSTKTSEQEKSVPSPQRSAESSDHDVEQPLIHPEDILSVACEVRLVQEYASMGTLRDCLNNGTLCVPGDTEGRQDFGRVLDTAMDMCKAVVHLHNENVVHCDFKTSNVLIVPMASSPKSFVAKVSDFGMAQSLSMTETHVSNVFHGTLTHMAPEVLVSGHVTFASDIYAMGIIMWELITRQVVKLPCLASMVPFMVSARGMRPILPAYCPKPFADLIRECWAGNHELRPTAHQVYHKLAQMSVAFAEGAFGPCTLLTSNDMTDAVNTEFTADQVSTYLLDAPTSAPRTKLEYVDELREACTSVGSSVRPLNRRASAATTATTLPTGGSNSAPSDMAQSTPATATGTTAHLTGGSGGFSERSNQANTSTSTANMSETRQASTTESGQRSSISSGNASIPSHVVNASFGDVLHRNNIAADAIREATPEPSSHSATGGGTSSEANEEESPAPYLSFANMRPSTHNAEAPAAQVDRADDVPEPVITPALVRATPRPHEAILFRNKGSTSESWDTFMLNQSEAHMHGMGLHGMQLSDIAEPDYAHASGGGTHPESLSPAGSMSSHQRSLTNEAGSSDLQLTRESPPLEARPGPTG